MLRKFSGALVSRTIDRSGRLVPEHAHDWPVLSLFVMVRTPTGPKWESDSLPAHRPFCMAWLGAAYKQAAGERLADTAARFRVECATRLLRETSLPYVDIAMEAGFCDQSHMIRTFRRILGRRPSAVRGDKKQFTQTLQSLTVTNKERPDDGSPTCE